MPDHPSGTSISSPCRTNLSHLSEFRWLKRGGRSFFDLQGMSYASGLAKLNPVAGIYSVIIPGLVYSLLGTCR